MGVSFASEDHVKGGFIEGAHTIGDAKIIQFAYKDKQGKTYPPAVGLELTFINSEGVLLSEQTQFYSAGGPDRWAPSDDGDELEPIAGQSGLNDSTNLHHFFVALENAGFPSDVLGEGKASSLIGLHANWVQREIKRSGANVKKDTSLTVVADIITMPGEDGDRFVSGGAGAKKGKGSRSSKGRKPATSTASKANGQDAAPASDVDPAAASELLVQIIMEKPDGVARKDLARAVITSGGDRKMATHIYNEDFLQTEDGWVYKDGIVSLM